MNIEDLPPDLPKSVTARVARPHRTQREYFEISLDERLPADHPVRILWRFVKGLNLDRFYEKIEVSGSRSGRTAIDPAILLALWLQGTVDGISSARELDRRTKESIVYEWLCGGVSVNYHTLSDFRSEHCVALESLLVDSVATLVDKGFVPLETIAQDGMRVRASAGKSSFRRKPTLEELQQLSAEHLERLKAEAEDQAKKDERTAAEQAAQQRAAEDKDKRLQEALRQIEELAKQKEARTKGTGEKARVSTTDPDARVMKMANGGFDPAYNVQLATDGDARIIVGVSVTNEGTDGAQMPQMLEKIEKNYEKLPEEILADSAFATKESVTETEHAGVKVVSSVPRADQLKKSGKDPHSKQKGDTKQYEDFRKRMAEEKYQELYKMRPSIAEFPNAVFRNRNLRQFRVRGLTKVLCVSLIQAIAFNFTRMIALGFFAMNK